MLFVATALGALVAVDRAQLPSAGQWFGVLGTTVLAAVLATLFGVGVGAVWNSVTGPVVTLIIWMIVVENLLMLGILGPLDLSWLGGVLPNNALNGIVGALAAASVGAAGPSAAHGLSENLRWTLQSFAGSPGSYAWWSATLVFLAWTLAFLGAGRAANRGRDIT